MFIAKGKAVHENLATSYVLVDALIDDLCEGGFSGIVELSLRDSDNYIVIDRGEVTATVQRTDRDGYSRASVADLAARSTRERGRLSVYSYSTGTASAIAGLFKSEPLYTQLSAEFTDLEKLISKLGRETNRQWFIEVDTGSGTRALIHIEDDRCRVITASGETVESHTGNLDLSANAILRDLIEECATSSGAFDVYFKSPVSAEPEEPELIEASTIEAPESSSPELDQAEVPVIEEAEAMILPETRYQERAASAAYGSQSTEGPFSDRGDSEGVSSASEIEQAIEPEQAKPREFLRDEDIEAREDRESLAESWVSVLPDSALPDSALPDSAPDALKSEPARYDAESELIIDTETQTEAWHPGYSEERSSTDKAPQIPKRPLETSDLGLAKEVLIMNDLKRLMGEIIRTIEDVARIVEQKDNFPVHLRSGQLKVADRFSFLDPFGAEFEYLAGEIAFVGEAGPKEFIEGITEALKLAVAEILESASQPARLSAIIAEDLRKLSNKNRAEFDMFDLDRAIERITDS